jgi:hypothetical protein
MDGALDGLGFDAGASGAAENILNNLLKKYILEPSYEFCTLLSGIRGHIRVDRYFEEEGAI